MKTILILFLCAANLAVFAQDKPAEQPRPAAVAADQADLRRESFEKVWRTVKEKHFDPSLGGVDWDMVHERYSLLLPEVKSDQELYDLLQRMLGELKQSHFRIISPDAVVNNNNSESFSGWIGIDLRMIDGQAVISRVEPDSPAAKAGLRTGFLLAQIDDKSLDQLGAEVKERMAKQKESAVMADFVTVRLLRSHINGKPGTRVSLKYLDEHDKTHAVTVEREVRKGEFSQPFGNFPAQFTEFETKRLPGGIGYFRFNVWVVSQMEKLRSALKEMKDAPGIIIDVRGNPGGLGGMASGLAGLLDTRQFSLGTMHLRSGYQNFVAFPQENAYTGPLAILIDFGSASTSEVFAAGMQEAGRAVIVGERSVGAALPSVFEKLPTGALFQYAIADFKTPKGVLVEGHGVIPDVEVKPTRAALLEGQDAPLEAAVDEIKRKAQPR
ncbi:MAG: PDZ domain-containing protein [Blastocatellia bacterium]|nr:PDZ domain-containing protein [Blastocatellia bacterium]